jgi:RNA polymerase sigma-70 factor, ECF subfamily
MVAMEADITLLDAARRMNGDALAKIFDLYSVALYKYALRLCNDSLVADHIVGDVFAKLLEYLSAGNGPDTNLRSYLYQMTYHLIVDESRYWHGRVALEVVDFLRYGEHSIYLGLEKRILFERVSQAIRNDLTDYQRHVIILRFLEGFSLRDTAVILGKTVNIVKAAQNRAIVILRKALDYQAIETSSISPGSENQPVL